LIKHIKNLLRPWKTPIDYILLITLKLFGAKRVISGPFKGLKFKQRFPTKPMLLGVWEKEISFIWNSLQMPMYIIDIGAAEGFYAVGLAKKYPKKKIYAFEMNPPTKRLLETVISDNSVTNIETHGKCEYEDLRDFGTKLEDSLIIMDCEGFEIELLKVESPSIFKKAHIVVELHEMYSPGCTKILKERFLPTHVVSELRGKHRYIEDWPAQLKFLRLLFPEKLLLQFMDEGRPYPMNWLYMKPRIN